MSERIEWLKEKAIQDDDQKNCSRWLTALAVRDWEVNINIAVGEGFIVSVSRPGEKSHFKGETVTQALRKAAWNKVLHIPEGEL